MASLDLSGHLLNLKIDLETSTNQPDATALTDNDINWLKNLTNIKRFVRTFPIFPKVQKGQIWGAFIYAKDVNVLLPLLASRSSCVTYATDMDVVLLTTCPSVQNVPRRSSPEEFYLPRPRAESFCRQIY